MAAQALYRKWRSQTFDEIVGQEHVTRTLRNALRDGRIAHAYLFTGPRGTGKTTTARLLAKAVNCLHADIEARPDGVCPICQAISTGTLLDLIEIDAASNRGIDEIRDLRDKVHFAPTQARYKVYVIDEVHMLTPEAFNALLKTLEEPPPHVVFVLATTEPHKIPDTVLSRCQRFDFHRIPTYLIAERLALVLEQEGRAAEPAALEMIARSADGSLRDALSLTDQLLSYGSQVISEAQVRAVRGAISNQLVSTLVDFLASRHTAGGLSLINQLASEGADLRQLTIQLVMTLRYVLLVRVAGREAASILSDVSADQLAAIQVQAEHLQTGAVTRAIKLLNQAGQEMRDAVQPQLLLELAWIDAVQAMEGGEGAQSSPATEARPAVLDTADSGGWQPADRSPAPFQAGAADKVAAPPVYSAGAGAVGEESILPRAGAPVPDDQVVSTLRAHWTALLHAAETARGGSLRGALRTLRHVVAQGNDVYFAFESEFSKTTVERPANKRAVQDLLVQLLGRPVTLHCQVGREVVGLPMASKASTPQSHPSAPELAAEDPLVEHARQQWGAQASAVA